jgi:predicted ester cyclase
MRKTGAAISRIALLQLLSANLAAAELQTSGKADMNAVATAQADRNVSESRVRKYYQTIEVQPFDETAISGFFAEDYRNYPPRAAAPGVSTKQATLGLIRMLSQGFPDARRELLIVEPISEGRVLVYFSFNGTHTGDFFGHPPTGRKVSFIGVDIFTIKDGRFVENWHVEDISKFLEQISGK